MQKCKLNIYKLEINKALNRTTKTLFYSSRQKLIKLVNNKIKKQTNKQRISDNALSFYFSLLKKVLNFFLHIMLLKIATSENILKSFQKKLQVLR